MNAAALVLLVGFGLSLLVAFVLVYRAAQRRRQREIEELAEASRYRAARWICQRRIKRQIIERLNRERWHRSDFSE